MREFIWSHQLCKLVKVMLLTKFCLQDMFFLSYIFAFLYYWYEQFMCSHCQCTFCKFSMGKKINWFMLLFKLNTSGKKALSTIFPFHNCYPYSHYTRRCTSFTPADIVNLESPCHEEIIKCYKCSKPGEYHNKIYKSMHNLQIENAN